VELQAFYAANRVLHSKIFSMLAALPVAGQPNRAGAQRGTAQDRRGQPNLCENKARVLHEQRKPLMSCSVATVRTERSYCLLREPVRNLHNLLSDILN
jgi:hypothetical protein